jgi:hypothetical protein
LTSGASIDQCAGANLAAATATTTDALGAFTLTGVPSGSNIPIVVQSGKWRREIVLANVSSCVNNTISSTSCIPAISGVNCSLRMPRSRTDGYDWVSRTYARADIPKIAIVSASADPFECMLLKTGIDPNEFGSVDSNGTRAVHFYESPDDPGTVLAPTFGNRVTGDHLWNQSAANGVTPALANYDVVLLPCEGEAVDKKQNVNGNTRVPYTSTLPPAGVDPYRNIINYANLGGRLFFTHFSYVWLQYPSIFGYGISGDNWGSVATWSHATSGTSPYMSINTSSYATQDPLSATLNQSFTKGANFATWLVNVGASTTLGSLAIHEARHDDKAVGPSTQGWMTATDTKSSVNPSSFPPHFTFNTPYAAAAANQYGRAVFSDYHVSASALLDSGGTSDACTTTSDCGFGQTCPSVGVTTPGSCTETCLTASDCPSAAYTCVGAIPGSCGPQVCSRNSDCGGGSCKSGKCSCGSGADCKSGSCSGFFTKKCATSSFVCTSDSQCGAAEQCNTTPGVCVKACTNNAGCSGEMCMSSRSWTTSQSFTQPAVGAAVKNSGSDITWSSVTGLLVGMTVYITNGGTYSVTAINTTTKRVGLTLVASAGNFPAGTSVSSYQSVTAACGAGEASCTCSGCTSAASCSSNLAPATCTGVTTNSAAQTCTPAAPSNPSGTNGLFPYACKQGALSAQEKALEFMFFDLTACVTPDSGGTVVAVPSTYAPGTFSQDFTATCAPGYVSIWREFDWQADVPTGASITIKAQSGASTASLLPVTPITLTTQTASTSGQPTNWSVAILDNSNGLTSVGTAPFNVAVPPVTSGKVLRMTITLNPTADGLQTPVLKTWKVQHDCVPLE